MQLLFDVRAISYSVILFSSTIFTKNRCRILFRVCVVNYFIFCSSLLASFTLEKSSFRISCVWHRRYRDREIYRTHTQKRARSRAHTQRKWVKRYNIYNEFVCFIWRTPYFSSFFFISADFKVDRLVLSFAFWFGNSEWQSESERARGGKRTHIQTHTRTQRDALNSLTILCSHTWATVRWLPRAQHSLRMVLQPYMPNAGGFASDNSKR